MKKLKEEILVTGEIISRARNGESALSLSRELGFSQSEYLKLLKLFHEKGIELRRGRRSKVKEKMEKILEEDENLLPEPEKDIFGLYLKEAGKYPLLTAEEERALGREWLEKGDIKSHKRLVEHNQRLVIKIAKRFRGWGLEYLDLIQTGNLGLMRTATTYDYKKGVRFATYAHFWIRQYITRAIHDHSRTIRFPVHVWIIFNKIWKTSGRLAQKLGREPTDEDTAAASKIPLKEVRKMLRLMNIRKIPLEAEIGGHGSSPDERKQIEVIWDRSSVDPGEYVADVEKKRKLIDLVERKLREIASLKNFRNAENNVEIFRLLYGLNGSYERETLQRIGQMKGFSRENIRQIKNQIWKKLLRRGIKNEEREFFEGFWKNNSYSRKEGL